MRVIVFLLAASASLHALGATIVGRVVAIADGDTITVLDGSRVQHKIRLAGIDAPEKKQAFGQASKESLSQLAYGRQAVVIWEKTDRYNRVVGKVMISDSDVCLEQVRRGMAWHYVKYAKEQPAEDAREYATSEIKARRENLGLWREARPVPPWDWRAEKKARPASY